MYDISRMPISPSQFLRQQLDLQQLTEREFAARSGLGLSHVYQILRGERKHIRGDTLDKVATGLGMTPADMAMGMGKGDTPVDPRLAALTASIASGWLQMDEAARELAERGARALFTVARTPRHKRPLDPPGSLGRSNGNGILQRLRPSDLRRREPRSIAWQRANYPQAELAPV